MHTYDAHTSMTEAHAMVSRETFAPFGQGYERRAMRNAAFDSGSPFGPCRTNGSCHLHHHDTYNIFTCSLLLQI